MVGEARQTPAQHLLAVHPPGRAVVPVQQLRHAQTGKDLLGGVGCAEGSHPLLHFPLQQGGHLGLQPGAVVVPGTLGHAHLYLWWDQSLEII